MRAQRLNSIRVEQHAALTAKPANIFQRLDHAGLIVGRHDADQNGLFRERILELRKINKAIVRRREAA